MSLAIALMKDIHAKMTVENKNIKTIFKIVSGLFCPGKYPKIPNSITTNHEINVAIKK